MSDVLESYSTRRTPQSRQAAPGQVKNAATGYTFEIDLVERVRRFLVLGTDSGTYYVGAAELTADAAGAVVKLAEADHRALVDTIVDVSLRGAAPKPGPGLFALAVACSTGDGGERARALDHLHVVARTGSHLLMFARYAELFRGWGRGLRRAVGGWYTGRSADDVAYQVVKYRQRDGWSHRDLLRLAHPAPPDAGMRAVFDWVAHNSTGDETPALIEGFVEAQEPGADVPALVREHRLSWEMLPDAALSKTAVWDALLDVGVPPTALMRQLPRLTRLGMLPAVGGRTAEVAARLADPARLRRGRVHPMNVLVAHRTYASGSSERGSSTWQPNRNVVDALDAAFYAAFEAVEPAGKRTMLGLDVSGSMTAPIAGMPLSCREASAALALVTLATEPDSAAFGFTASRQGMFSVGPAEFKPLALSPSQRLADATREVSRLPFGRTDCALPMQYAIREHLEVDTFVIYTDNETWAGVEHPFQALRRYREAVGIPARLVVVGMTATGFTIADPSDAGMLDVAGFDVGVPALLSAFSRGV